MILYDSRGTTSCWEDSFTIFTCGVNKTGSRPACNKNLSSRPTASVTVISSLTARRPSSGKSEAVIWCEMHGTREGLAQTSLFPCADASSSIRMIAVIVLHFIMC